MEIKVQKKLATGQVRFESDFGTCEGIWNDDEPESNRKYTVEIEIPEHLTAARLALSDEKHCILEKIEEEETVHIVGQLEDYEEDGFAVLRLEDSIICFNTKYDEQIEAMHGKFIEFEVEKIHLSKVGI
ncbi:hypothetical protein [Listeria grandensis]|uniref:hypothetical protein n=1 Tax=Listeria grandensis TaxID=1494963 RepID=UPI00164ED316|nr:hypothetical protein [Listeria grandensis]MBC6315129.1 hypothetical protein [Listeria grandensis]